MNTSRRAKANMLSRRNIRIKVMQSLYAKNRDPQLTLKDMLRDYHKSISKSYELYLFNLLQLSKVARYSIQDAAKRNSRLLPSEKDKEFRAKLAENDLLSSLSKNEALEKIYREFYLDTKTSKDTTRALYTKFSQKEAYQEYVFQKETTAQEHQKMLLDLYKFCLGDELFTDLMGDHFYNWIDDESLIVGTIKKTIKALPAGENFYEKYRPTEETTIDFGEQMLRLVYEEDEEYLAIIEPNLQNWDKDRVAVLDMILLKMAICELLVFPTIPTKVTLNEFVEISKLYSTDKSKDFINGILDRMLKKLSSDGKINKEGRGLQN